DHWYDDTCDGPVSASLEFPDGSTAVADPAWVIVGPFDFAPETMSLITLYDVAFQAAVDNGWVSIPSTVFDLHVLPILTRPLGYRWVNAGAMGAQPGHRHPAWVDQLAKVRDPADPDGRRLRRMLFAHIREVPTPASTRHPVQALMPRLHDHE